MEQLILFIFGLSDINFLIFVIIFLCVIILNLCFLIIQYKKQNVIYKCKTCGAGYKIPIEYIETNTQIQIFCKKCNTETTFEY